MKLHCQENKRSRNENLCFSDRKEQEFGGTPSSGFKVRSSEFEIISELEPRTRNFQLGTLNADAPTREFENEDEGRGRLGETPLPARQHLQQKPLKIFRLGEMRKNRVVERLRQTLQNAHMPLRIDAGFDNHLQKHFAGNMV